MNVRFSTQVKEMLSCSAEEAWRLLDTVITPAHLLLGIIRQGDNTALTILTTGFGVSPADLKTGIEATLVHPPVTRRQSLISLKRIPLGKDAEGIIRRGVDEAARLKNRETGAEHLLLAMLEPPAGDLADLFSGYGVNYTAVYEKISGPH